MKLFKIYKYTNLITGMSYIGRTCETLKRRAGSKMKGYIGCEKFWEAIQHYGTDCWRVEILWDGLTLDEANVYEELEIQDNETLYPYGYNKTPHGRVGTYGCKKPQSEETKRKISESAKSSPLVAEAQRLATEAAAEKARGVPRPKEVRDKISVGHRKSDYAEMHDFFLSLPTDMHLSEKTRLLRERFPNVGNRTIYFRLRKWTGLKGSKRLPVYQEIYEFYLTLPSDMLLPEKRHLLHKEFPNVSRFNINRWLNKWSGTQTLIRHPDKIPARELFLSLPAEMSLPEKRQLLYEQFPNVKRNTMNSWTQKWSDPSDRALGRRHPQYNYVHKFFLALPSDLDLQEKRKQCYSKFSGVPRETIWKWVKKWQPNNDSAFKRKERQKNREQGYELFMSLPCDLTIEEKRKFLREKMLHVNRRTIYRWVRKWQSELEATQQP